MLLQSELVLLAFEVLCCIHQYVDLSLLCLYSAVFGSIEKFEIYLLRKLDWANSAPTYPQTGHHSRNMF